MSEDIKATVKTIYIYLNFATWQFSILNRIFQIDINSSVQKEQANIKYEYPHPQASHLYFLLIHYIFNAQVAALRIV